MANEVGCWAPLKKSCGRRKNNKMVADKTGGKRKCLGSEHLGGIQHLISAQDMTSQLVGLSPTLGSALPVWDSLFASLSAPPPPCVLSLSK